MLILCVRLYSSRASARTQAAVGIALRDLRMRRPRPVSRHPVSIQDGDAGSRERRGGVRGSTAELSSRGSCRRLSPGTLARCPQRRPVLFQGYIETFSKVSHSDHSLVVFSVIIVF